MMMRTVGNGWKCLNEVGGFLYSRKAAVVPWN